MIGDLPAWVVGLIIGVIALLLVGLVAGVVVWKLRAQRRGSSSTYQEMV